MSEYNEVARISRIAALVEHFERRCEQSSAELRQLTQQVPMVLRKAADDELKRLPGEIIASVRQGIERPVAGYEARLEEASQQLHKAAFALSAQLERAERLHKHLVWKVAGIALGTLALLLVAGGWLSNRYYDEIRRNQVAAELLKAYNAADVTLCDGRLCANVGQQGAEVRRQEAVPSGEAPGHRALKRLTK
ncbi:hypothetical protein GCM10027431_28150 [Lysobacter rhizosphaerae]